MQTKSVTDEKGALFFRLLFNKYFTAKADLLKKLMPKEDFEVLQKTDCPGKNPEVLLFDPNVWLSSSDPSWFIPLLDKLPQELLSVYLHILPKEIVGAYAVSDKGKRCKVAKTSAQVSSCIRIFLLQYLYKLQSEPQALAKELLPPSDLHPLLDCTKQDLHDIIDLLSMQDLVDEVRHIVDKRILQLLSKLLTTKQQAYLKMCLRQKTKPHTPTFSLKEQLKEPQKFVSEIRTIGIKRMACALSGENKDFVWHILHTLDMPSAKSIQEHIELQPIAAPAKGETKYATKLGQIEIMQILQFLKASMKT